MTTKQINPFPGLRSFDIDESHLFFGREEHVTDVLNKLKNNHFVAVVGTSGTGKSSLIRAGVLPAIKSGAVAEQGKKWLIASMKPGSSPLENLTTALVDDSVFGNSDDAYKDILTKVQESSLGLVQALRTRLSSDQQLLILVDQFEEIFRFSDTDIDSRSNTSNDFVKLIIDTVRQRDIPIYVLLTLRSDFLGDCVRFEGLPEAINDGHYLVPRMNKEQNRRVITGPVEYAEGKISPRLVQHVISHIADDMDQLPVLQHSLMRTWDNWRATAEQGEPMDLQHYENIGGMESALSDHADEAFMELNGTQQDLLQHLFKALTMKTGDNRGVRRPTSMKNLCDICKASSAEVEEALTPFRMKGRSFILPDGNARLSESTVLDISHESLMRGWNRLNSWVEEETESAAVYERLCAAATLHKDGKAGLWRDPELQLALDWKEKNQPNEAWSQQYNEDYTLGMKFLDDSLQGRIAEQKAARNRRKLISTSVIAFLIVVSGLTAWALLQTKTANENTVIAEQKTEEALNQKKLAESAKEMALKASQEAMDAASFAKLQSDIAEEQKTIAEEQKLLAEEEAQRAIEQQELASKSRQIAEEKNQEALAQKLKADSAKAETNRLRMISVGQNIAFKSLQIKNDPELSVLLSYQACRLVKQNKGNMHDQQLYAAAFSAARNTSDGYKEMGGIENGEVKSIGSTGNSLKVLLSNGGLKSYTSGGFKSGSKSTLAGLPGNVNTAYMNSSGEHLIIGTGDHKAVHYKLGGSAKLQNTMSGHRGLIRAAAFSSDNSTIATGGRDSLAIIWRSGSEVQKQRFSSRIRALEFLGSSGTVLVGCEDGKIYSFDSGTGSQKVFASNPGKRVESIAVADNGSKVIAGFSDGAVAVYSKSGSLKQRLSEKGIPKFMDIDRGQDLLVVGTTARLIHIYKLSDLTIKPMEIAGIKSPIKDLTLSKDKFIYIACSDNSVRRYPAKLDFYESFLSDKIDRDLTVEEWEEYLGPDVPYEKLRSN